LFFSFSFSFHVVGTTTDIIGTHKQTQSGDEPHPPRSLSKCIMNRTAPALRYSRVQTY